MTMTAVTTKLTRKRSFAKRFIKNSTSLQVTRNDVINSGWGYYDESWGAGIRVWDSDSIQVGGSLASGGGNLVAWNADGISIEVADGGSSTGVEVHRNMIAMGSGDATDTYSLYIESGVTTTNGTTA